MRGSEASRSNVCLGVRVDFYWVDNPSQDESEHVSHAVKALFDAISIPGVRLWTPYNAPLVKAEFKKRIEKAMRGQLEPPSELKPIGGGDLLPLYEIRWSGISVHEQPPDGGQARYFKVEARLLHGEPIELSVCFVGLHAHEKQYEGSHDEVKRAQDDHIEIAATAYRDAQSLGWDVLRRTSLDEPAQEI